MKKSILIFTLAFVLTCSFAIAASQPEISVIVVNPIIFDSPGKIIATTTGNIKTENSMIPSGTKLVFYKSARTKDTHLSMVNAALVRGITPEGRILTPQGQDTINVSLVFTSPESMKWIEDGKGIEEGTKANVVFVEQIGLATK